MLVKVMKQCLKGCIKTVGSIEFTAHAVETFKHLKDWDGHYADNITFDMWAAYLSESTAINLHS